MKKEGFEVVMNRKYEDDHTMAEMTIFNEGVEVSRMYTMENPWLDNKRSVSCIPQGQYNCVPYSSVKYKGVYEVKNVKCRSYILIHVGNYTKDTEGCILPGKTYSKPMKMVKSSVKAMNEFRDIIGSNEFKLYVNGDIQES